MHTVCYHVLQQVVCVQMGFESRGLFSDKSECLRVSHVRKYTWVKAQPCVQCTKCATALCIHSLWNVFPSLSTCSGSHMPLSLALPVRLAPHWIVCVYACALWNCGNRSSTYRPTWATIHILTNRMGLLNLMEVHYITDSYRKAEQYKAVTNHEAHNDTRAIFIESIY